MVPVSRRPAHVALVMGLSAFLLSCPSGAANRHWLPAVQVSHEDYGSVPWTLVEGRVNTRALHATIHTQTWPDTTGSELPGGPGGISAADCNVNDAAYDYVTASMNSNDWATTWADAWDDRERFGWENPDRIGWHSTDARLALDDSIGVYTVWEEHQIYPNGIGYKKRESGWAGVPPDFSDVPPDTVNKYSGSVHGAFSPRLVIEPLGSGATDDIHHVLFKPGGLWHRARSAGGWGTARALTDYCDLTVDLGSPLFLIDADRSMHLVGACSENAAGSEHVTVHYMHLRLQAATTDSVWRKVGQDTSFVLDDWHVNPNCSEGEAGVDAAFGPAVSLVQSGAGSPSRLGVVYAMDGTTPLDVREVVYRSIDMSAGTKGRQVRVTAPDGRRSGNPAMFVSTDSTTHVVYIDGPTRRLEKYFDCDETLTLCEHGETDPSGYPGALRNELRYVSGRGVSGAPDSVAFGLPQPFTADMRTAFARPMLVAQNDSVWALFASHDDGDAAYGGTWHDGTWQTWFRLGAPMPATTVAGDSVHWNGEIYLDRDFVVESGKKLIIDAGTAVVAASLTDSSNASGGTPGLVDIIVRGTLEVRGDEEHPVKFRSVDQNEGDWGGLLFDLAAASTGYGYTCNSAIAYASVHDGAAGIRVANTAAPGLTQVAFANNENGRDIVLAGSDVYVPHDVGWNLVVPVHVVVEPHASGAPEISGRNAGLVDLVVHGPLITTGGAGDSVYFGPDFDTVDEDSIGRGSAWGGIFVDYWSSGSAIAYTDVGYARTPITLFLQDAVVQHSRLHHFADQGLSILGSGWGGGPQVLGNLVERGSGLSGESGTDGIVINQAASGSLSGNTVKLTNSPTDSLGVGGGGIRFIGGKTFCEATSADTLMISGNALIGPGGAYDGGGATWSALKGDWLCGAGARKTIVKSNTIRYWNGAGIDLHQSEDAQFTCNVVDSCRTGLRFSRDALDSVGVRFKSNSFQIGAFGFTNDQNVVITDNSPWLKLGPSGTNTGWNVIETRGLDLFVEENDASAVPLNAIKSRWKRNGTGYTDPDSIRSYIAGQVSVDSALTAWSPCGEVGTQALPQGGYDIEDRDSGASGVARETRLLPGQTELAVLREPRGGIEVRFALAGPERRRVEIDVFNVAGRRVSRLVEADLEGGRYGASWSGLDGSGGRAGSGVYLIRMRAGTEIRVHKAVLVR